MDFCACDLAVHCQFCVCKHDNQAKPISFPRASSGMLPRGLKGKLGLRQGLFAGG